MSNKITKPFNADKITVNNWDPMLKVRKKPIVVHATQLSFSEGFEVTTKEGKLRGKPGDYLMVGIEGEKYPIDKDIFEKTYDIMGNVEKVIFFSNGNTACFDRNGHQIPELQKSWIQLYFAFLESRGVSPKGIVFDCPNMRIAKPFKTLDGSWNWEYSDEG